MAEVPHPGPVSSKGRPVIGARLAIGFLAAVRAILVLVAAILFGGVFVMVATVCFVEEPVWHFLLRAFLSLGVLELLIAMALGAKWIESTIRARYEGSGSGGPDSATSVGPFVVIMIEIVMVLSGFALLLWIPAEISRVRNMGLAWPASWAIAGGLA